MKKLFTVLFVRAITFAIITLVWGGIVWVLCWGLTSIGITTIGGWTVAFSWKLVLIVALVASVLKSIFSTEATTK